MGQILYYNGTIITMEERNAPYAEAVLTEGERIKARGSFDAVKAQASKEAHLADLQARTMIPGFIDPHSHFTACAGKIWKRICPRQKHFRILSVL